MAVMCNSCSKPLRGSKYYEVICRDATEREDRKKEIDDLQQNSNEENKEKKVNDLATLKAKLSDLEERMKDVDDKELDDLLESVRADMDELEKLNPDEEAKKSKSAMSEFVGIDNHYSAGIDGDAAVEKLTNLENQRHRHRQKKLKHSQSYSVLTLTDSNDSVNADGFFIKQGSTD